MKIKERMKNVGFWVSILSAIFLILGAFGVRIADATADSVISAVCSVLVVFGIVSDPTTGKGFFDGYGDDAEELVDKADDK
ncbi:MAG: holin [Clostridiales bacterium]|nr:holin [Clostridiales bacterium]